MKKKILPLISAVLVLVAVLFAGCAEGQQALEGLQKSYANISKAKKIEQTIETKSGNLVQYTSNTVYIKTDDKTNDVYNWTQTKKTLNKINATSAEAYSTETAQGTVAGVKDFAPTLKLDEQYFAEGYEASGNSLNATVKSGNERDVLGITGNLIAPTNNMVIAMSVNEKQVTSLNISYQSNDFTVVISLTFTY